MPNDGEKSQNSVSKMEMLTENQTSNVSLDKETFAELKEKAHPSAPVSKPVRHPSLDDQIFTLIPPGLPRKPKRKEKKNHKIYEWEGAKGKPFGGRIPPTMDAKAHNEDLSTLPNSTRDEVMYAKLNIPAVATSKPPQKPKNDPKSITKKKVAPHKGLTGPTDNKNGTTKSRKWYNPLSILFGKKSKDEIKKSDNNGNAEDENNNQDSPEYDEALDKNKNLDKIKTTHSDSEEQMYRKTTLKNRNSFEGPNGQEKGHKNKPYIKEAKVEAGIDTTDDGYFEDELPPLDRLDREKSPWRMSIVPRKKAPPSGTPDILNREKPPWQVSVVPRKTTLPSGNPKIVPEYTDRKYEILQISFGLPTYSNLASNGVIENKLVSGEDDNFSEIYYFKSLSSYRDRLDTRSAKSMPGKGWNIDIQTCPENYIARHKHKQQQMYGLRSETHGGILHQNKCQDWNNDCNHYNLQDATEIQCSSYWYETNPESECEDYNQNICGCLD